MKTIFKVEFCKTFTSGILKGISRYESLPFPTISGAEKWIQAIQKSKTLNYIITDTRILKE